MVRPDEAMGQLFPAAGPAADGPAAGLDVTAQLTLAVGGMERAARLLAARARLSWEQCHPIDIPPGQSKAPGVLDQPDVWGPHAGGNVAWHVLLLTAVLGPSGTLMTLYRDAPSPTNVVLQSTVSGLFEPRRLILMPGRRLVWSSAGDVLTVSTGIAVEVALDALPAYLMGVG